ncbi:MAG: MOSC domain-containing protein [Edwardsiella phage MSW-3]|uniref:Uncharacterized protein n=1 Tax=Edwardsiella phage MSW-3 TaxID=1264700 RepID=L0MXF8_9CAUD|nr:hypothetical protein G428_gp47 [Edwardsiella phage MSW-3]BAM68868.1 hypothetical protein [Edwardsiella phage MSW-3]BEU28775.1 MAG: MOSC domain-containing protein [Edwardsiella phage MSW-3]
MSSVVKVMFKGSSNEHHFRDLTPGKMYVGYYPQGSGAFVDPHGGCITEKELWILQDDVGELVVTTDPDDFVVIGEIEAGLQ